MVPAVCSEVPLDPELSWMGHCLVIATLLHVPLRLKKGSGTARLLLTARGTCPRSSPLAFVNNISLTPHENLQAAKEK